MTWDEMKRARDGTLAPLIPNRGETSAEVAYRKELIKRRDRLRDRREWAEEEVAEAQARVDQISEEIEVVELEMEEMGMDP